MKWEQNERGTNMKWEQKGKREKEKKIYEKGEKIKWEQKRKRGKKYMKREKKRKRENVSRLVIFFCCVKRYY